MYLAHGYKKRHCYDSETMETQEYKMGEHDGVLLIYELPDTVKEKRRRLKLMQLCGIL